jgi:oxygen-dependent protoporphyrinogen oxidase
VLLRAFAGGALQPEIFALDDGDMRVRVETSVRELLGITEEPLFVEIAKWKESMPQYQVGHLERVNEIEKLTDEIAGLALAGNAYRGAGIPDCIRSGQTAAELLLR